MSTFSIGTDETGEVIMQIKDPNTGTFYKIRITKDAIDDVINDLLEAKEMSEKINIFRKPDEKYKSN